MTKDEFMGALGVAEVSYRNFDITGKKMALGVWFDLFENESLETFIAAIKLHIQTEKYPPTPASIRECLDELKGDASGIMTAEEAWTQAKKLCRYAYDKKALGQKLKELQTSQPALRETLKAISIAELAFADLDQIPILRSQFMKAYANNVGKERSRAISAPMLEKLTGDAMPLKLIENPALQYEQRKYADGELDYLIDEL